MGAKVNSHNVMVFVTLHELKSIFVNDVAFSIYTCIFRNINNSYVNEQTQTISKFSYSKTSTSIQLRLLGDAGSCLRVTAVVLMAIPCCREAHMKVSAPFICLAHNFIFISLGYIRRRQIREVLKMKSE